MDCGSARRRATPTSPLTPRSASAGRPSPTPRRSSARRRRGTSGRSAGTWRTPRPPPRRADRCSVSTPSVELRSTSGERRVALADLFTRSRPDQHRVERAHRRRRAAGARGRGQLLRPTRVPPADGDRRGRRDRGRAPRGRCRAGRPDRHHRPRPDGPSGGRGRVGPRRYGRRARSGRRGGPPGSRGGDADLGRPGLARLSPGDGGRRRPPGRHRCDRPGARRDRVEIPASASLFGAG